MEATEGLLAARIAVIGLMAPEINLVSMPKMGCCISPMPAANPSQNTIVKATNAKV